MLSERRGGLVIPLPEMPAPEIPYAGSILRCWAHRLDDFGTTRARNDVAPYECADCVNERNDYVLNSLSFFDDLDSDRQTRKQLQRDEDNRVWVRRLSRRGDPVR